MSDDVEAKDSVVNDSVEYVITTENHMIFTWELGIQTWQRK